MLQLMVNASVIARARHLFTPSESRAARLWGSEWWCCGGDGDGCWCSCDTTNSRGLLCAPVWGWVEWKWKIFYSNFFFFLSFSFRLKGSQTARLASRAHTHTPDIRKINFGRHCEVEIKIKRRKNEREAGESKKEISNRDNFVVSCASVPHTHRHTVRAINWGTACLCIIRMITKRHVAFLLAGEIYIYITMPNHDSATPFPHTIDIFSRRLRSLAGLLDGCSNESRISSTS